MARMYPAYPLDEAISPAESRLFRALELGLSDEFTVLHSVKWLGRAGGRDHDGECDFLIAHPKYGVLILEVKGGEIRRNGSNGQWYSKNQAGEEFLIRSPFDQARKAIFSLRSKFRDARFSREVCSCIKRAVALPDVEIGSRDLGPDAPRSLILDASDLLDVSTGVMQAWQPADDSEIGESGVEAIVGLLSPAVELRRPRMASEITRDQEEFIRLTQEQMRVLDLLSGHRRVGIQGVAGSGKSILAIETVRRLAEQGFRVLYTCFNLALADWARDSLTESLGAQFSLVYVDSYHDLTEDFVRRANIAPPDPEGLDGGSATYYREVLPQLFMDAVGQVPDRFDAIVVDEGQDFDDIWWLTLESLQADPVDGIFFLFYDDNQLLFLDRGDYYPVPPPHHRLTYNCRTTRHIHDVAGRYGHNAQRETCLGPEGRAVEIERIESGKEIDALRKVIHRLIHDEQVPLNEIVVLTARSRQRTTFSDGTKVGNLVLSWDGPGPNRLQMTSIHKFKGLQAPVVVLAELDHAYRQTRDALVHVGMTRAQHHVVVLGELPEPRGGQT
ncbi:ATP-binding domain-containing protein [soil metagenome]